MSAVIRVRPATYKSKILKAIALSTSALVCFDQLLSANLCTCNQLFLKFLYNSTFSWGAHEATTY